MAPPYPVTTTDFPESILQLQDIEFGDSFPMYLTDPDQYSVIHHTSASCGTPPLFDTNSFYPHFFSSDDFSSPCGPEDAKSTDATHRSETLPDLVSSTYDHCNLTECSLSPSVISPPSSSCTTTPNEECPKSSNGQKEGVKVIRFQNSNKITIERSQKVFCETCGEQYASLSALAAHQRQRQKSYKCKLCPREFPKLNNLRRHQRSHDGPFPCDHCHKEFEKRSTWRDHQQVHDPHHKTFACTRKNCHRVYQRAADYNRHVEFVSRAPFSAEDYAVQPLTHSNRDMERGHIRADTVIRILSDGLTQEIGEFSWKVRLLRLHTSRPPPSKWARTHYFHTTWCRFHLGVPC